MSGSEVTLQDISPTTINVNFNNEEIAGREPESVLFDENRFLSFLILIINRLAKV